MTKKKRELIEILLENINPEDWPENLPYAVYGKETCKCYATADVPIASGGYWILHDKPKCKLIFESTEQPKYWNKTIVHRDEFMKRWNEQNQVVDSEGWIQWNGGEMPVEKGTLIDVEYRDGVVNLHVESGVNFPSNGSVITMSANRWTHTGADSDIIAYKMHDAQQQKTPQQLALEKFGTDWHENDGVQPVDDNVFVDYVLNDGYISLDENTSVWRAMECDWGLGDYGSSIKKWRIHSDDKEDQIKTAAIKAAKSVMDKPYQMPEAQKAFNAAKSLSDGMERLNSSLSTAQQAFDGFKNSTKYLTEVEGEWQKDWNNPDDGLSVSFVDESSPLKTQVGGINDVISDRGRNYGRFEDGAEIMQQLKKIAHTSQGWERMKPIQREGMDMILHKIGRILNGNPNYVDSWVDIEGYSKLVSDWLKGDSK